jgi:hypothetical protein
MKKLIFSALGVVGVVTAALAVTNDVSKLNGIIFCNVTPDSVGCLTQLTNVTAIFNQAGTSTCFVNKPGSGIVCTTADLQIRL